MEYKDFKDSIIKHAKNEGIDVYDIYFSRSQSTTVGAYDGKIEKFSDNSLSGVCFRCAFGEKIGLAHTQVFSDEEALRLVKSAKEAGEILDEIPGQEIFKGSATYPEIKKTSYPSADINELKEKTLSMEKSAKDFDKRVKSVPRNQISHSKTETAIYNSYGMDLQSENSYYVAACQVFAEDDDEKSMGFDYIVTENPADINPEKISKKAAGDAVNTLYGTSVLTGESNVVFENKMVCEMLGTFSGIFSGDAAEKGLSMLKGKEGELIASDIVSIVDDPLYEKTPFKNAFDDEGVACFRKDIISAGKLSTLLYDIKSGAKAGKKSTGNGQKSSYASGVGVSFFHMILKEGDISRSDLLEKAGEGVYINSLKGMHASADPASGDFSLEAKGFFIKDGKLAGPTKSFTVAGNFYDMLGKISALADDLYLDISVSAPAILVEKLSIAG